MTDRRRPEFRAVCDGRHSRYMQFLVGLESILELFLGKFIVKAQRLKTKETKTAH